MMGNGLFRSRDEAVIGGVCAGLGKYLAVDPALVRILFLLLVLGNGIRALIYFLFWIIIPLESQPIALSNHLGSGSHEITDNEMAVLDDGHVIVQRADRRLGFVIGAVLIIFGLFYLFGNLPLEWARWIDFDLMWPSLLIIGGLVLLFRRR